MSMDVIRALIERGDYIEQLDSDVLLGAVYDLLDRAGPSLIQTADEARDCAIAWQHAFEFRNLEWFEPEVLAVLRDHDAAMVVWHMQTRVTPVVATAPFTYLRFHGTTGKYDGSYSPGQISVWADVVRDWLAAGRTAWCFFNNDIGGHAVRDAARLTDAVRQLTPPSPGPSGVESPGNTVNKRGITSQM